MCGWTLAGAHARSGDAVAIDAYLGCSDVIGQALADSARACTDQDDADHQRRQHAIAVGDIIAETGELSRASRDSRVHPE
jgi:hypothetical protein